MIVHRILIGSALVIFGGATALSQQQPTYSKIFESDSLELLHPELSPNRKWVVFAARRQSSNKRFLMIVAGQGGQPRRLTSDGYDDNSPVWFPGSDRIVFRSSRANGGLMTLRIDPAMGEAKGNPQRLTLQPVQSFGYTPSPDGSSVFFTTEKENSPDRPELMIVPASGGKARLLATMPKGPVVQVWWNNPDSIVFSHFESPFPQARFTIWSIPTRGGSPRLLRTSNVNEGFTILAPNYLVRGARLRMAGDTMGVLSLTSPRGDTLLRLDSRRSKVLGGLNYRLRPSRDGQSIMLAADVGTSVTRVLSMDGGAPRDIRPARQGSEGEYPYAFTSDSKGVWVQAEAENRMEIVPIAGGQARSVSLPPRSLWPHPTPSGRWIYVLGGHAVDTLHTLHVVEVATGRTELISRAAGEVNVAGPRGDDEYYWESKNGAVEIRRWTPGKGSILLHVIPPGRYYERSLTSQALGPQGRSYAFAKFDKDTARVFVGDSAGPRQVFAVRGMSRKLAFSAGGRLLGVTTREPAATGKDSVGVAYIITLDDRGRMIGAPRVLARTAIGGNFTWPAFSDDGSTLAFGIEHKSDKEPQVSMLLMSVNERAGEVGAPRRIEIPPPASEWDDLAWSGDGKYVLLTTYEASTNRSSLWRIPARGNDPPVNIAKQERNQFWEVTPSPDGKWVAYQADLAERNTIWRIDLPSGVIPRK